MRPPVKVGLVVAGYIVAFLIASAVVGIYVASTSGPDRQGYGGMYAFGDSLLFLAVFGVAAVPPTGAALFFPRSYRSFWLALSVAALVIAATGLAAFIDYVAARTAEADSILHAWSALAVLRILVAPLFALAFFLSVLFAPNRSSRIALLVATVIEAAVFAYVAVIWLHPFRPQ
jgi:hypothetical protein